MDEKKINSWSKFEKELLDLHNRYDEKKLDFLYRGHGNSKWKLETTLERKIKKRISVFDYFRFISVIKPKIETVTDKTWDIINVNDYEKWLKDMRSDVIRGFPSCDYFAYLRHHGFPSPLLDWSKSPYVAAFFAMNEANENDCGCVSIYIYLETKTVGKIWDNQSPGINKLGPYIKTHKRHYLQQSTYTICTYYENNTWYYGNHEDVFSYEDENQDLLWKLIIPKGKKREFVEKLEAMNINSFSLFQTEDALMEHIFLSEVFLANHL